MDTKQRTSGSIFSWGALLKEVKQDGKDDLFSERMQLNFERFPKHMISYEKYLHCETQDSNSNEDGVDSSSSLLTKEIVLETRAALRFATFCLASENTRSVMQTKAVSVYQWHVPLCLVLSHRKGDAKCRILSARLLSNLVTCNSETALAVASDIHISPSVDAVTSRIRSSLSVGAEEKDNVKHTTTWVDMMLACSACREALAALVAALHNCLCSIDPQSSFDSKLASDSLLISTLLRQMLPANSITNDGHGDSATEWITLVIEKLCRLGLLPEMYSSAAGGVESTSSSNVTPEHVVLLHCVARAVDEATGPLNKDERPFLGGGSGSDATVSSHIFLARQCSILRQNTCDSDHELRTTALSLMLEMLASSLGMDGQPSMEQVRIAIGEETSLLQEVALDLGSIVDALTARNQGRTAREFHMSETEQRHITGLVRFLGNVCFRCRQNQDLIRQIKVPFANEHISAERTVLHVLLSCTSFSFGCFTLREWAIVALRNVLEGNEQNQAVVEQLEAQRPAQSAELENMGIRVDMDQSGEVRVVPTDNSKSDSEKE